MKTYTLYFTLFGKRMKTTVDANSKQEAKEAIRNKIVFDKVECDTDPDLFSVIDGFADFLKTMGVKRKKP